MHPPDPPPNSATGGAIPVGLELDARAEFDGPVPSDPI